MQRQVTKSIEAHAWAFLRIVGKKDTGIPADNFRFARRPGAMRRVHRCIRKPLAEARPVSLFFSLYEAIREDADDFFRQIVYRLRRFQSRQAIGVKHGKAVVE